MAQRRNLQYVVGADVSQAKKGFRALSGEVSCITKGMHGLSASLKSTMMGLASFAGIQAAQGIAGSFIQAAKQTENYQAKLRAVIKNATEANAAFKRIYDWAAKNPIDTDEAVGAFVALKSAAVKNNEEAMKAIADISTVMGKDMRDVAQAVISTEVEPLRNMGILLERAGRRAIIQSGEMRLSVGNDIESIRQGLIEIIGLNFGGAMDQAAGTFDGLMKTMGGLWGKFKTDLMGDAGSGGPFDAIKRMISRINDEWAKWTDSPDYKAFLADVQRSTTRALEQLTRFGEGLGSAFRVALEHLDEVIAGCEALIVMFASRGLFAMLGVPATIATITGAAVGLSTAFPPATDAASRLKDEISRVEGQVEALRQAAAQSVVLGITVDDRELQEAASRLDGLRAVHAKIPALLAAEDYDAKKRQSQTMNMLVGKRGLFAWREFPAGVSDVAGRHVFEGPGKTGQPKGRGGPVVTVCVAEGLLQARFFHQFDVERKNPQGDEGCQKPCDEVVAEDPEAPVVAGHPQQKRIAAVAVGPGGDQAARSPQGKDGAPLGDLEDDGPEEQKSPQDRRRSPGALFHVFRQRAQTLPESSHPGGK